MSDKPTVVEALAAVMEEVQAIRKGDRNTQQNFNFRGIDAVVNAVGPALRKHGVIVIPTGAHYDEQRYESRNGAQMRGVTTSVCYRFYGPAGDHIDANVLGEASDSGDKAIPKAFSVAFRTLLLQTLCVPTDEVDPDAQSHERVARSNGSAGAGERSREDAPAGDPHGLQASRADAVQPSEMVVTFGKHKGRKVHEVPTSYWDWWLAQDGNKNPELLAAVELHLGLTSAATSAPGAPDDLDIPFRASEF